ncbi:hypothetical protein YSY43_13950 [Paenibacillus sp. YSY-4.3]
MALPSMGQQAREFPVRSAKQEAIRPWLHRVAVSLLLYALFAECLYPLYSIVIEHERSVIDVFLYLTGALLLASCLRLAPWVQALLCLTLIGGTLFYLFGLQEGISWFNGYGTIVAQDIAATIQTGRLNEASPESRMLLLLIGWGLLVVSVQMLAVGRQTILLFLSVVIVYLLTIELIFEAPIFFNLVRAAGIGLGLQSYAFAMQLREQGYIKQKPSLKNGKSYKEHAYKIMALLTVVGLLVCAAGLCLLLPAQPVQQQPLQALIKSLRGWYEKEGLAEASVATSSVSGYGRDDGELGAPLQLRWDTYFTAKSPVSVYWRGESKSVYTGRGWLQPARGEEVLESSEGLSLLPQDDDIAGLSTIRQTITFQKPVTRQMPLLSGGTPVQVDRVFAEDGTSIPFVARLDQAAGAIYLNKAGQAQQPLPVEGIQGYELTVIRPPAAGGHLRQRQGSEPASISERYLQLPDSLPERVRALGQTLVRDADNRYDAAMAVAKYLKQHYSYNLNSAIPPADEDFADRFLFVDRQGYCDHFSTAMVVLLRSGEIPARWVKGFTPGERSKEEPDSYTISYADAHAWVEVYFPGEGWVPFDPTPGYDSVMSASTGMGAQLLPVWIQKIAGSAQRLPTAIKSILDHGFLTLWESLAKAPLIWTAGLLVVWPSVWLILWIGRNSSVWRNLLTLRRMIARPRSRFPDQRLLLHVADRVWQQIYRVYGNKPEGMTAREYVDFLSAQEKANLGKLEEFVREWEILYYGGLRPDRMNSRNFLELCRNLALRRG